MSCRWLFGSGGRRLSLRPTGIVVLIASFAQLLTGCSTQAVNGGRLQDAVGISFSRLFVLQQTELGHSVPPPDRSASCTRNGSTVPTGAGSWTCVVHFPAGDGHIEPLPFDVEVQPMGCYSASGPPGAVGSQQMRTAAGAVVTNPLFAFDGCFDTS